MELQMYRHPPGEVRLPGPRDHVLVLNRAGRALIDDSSDGRRQQAWVDTGYFSLTPAGQPVSRSWKGRPEVLLIYLNPELVIEVARELDLDPSQSHLTPRVGVPDQTLHHFGLMLGQEAVQSDSSSALMVDSLTRALTVHLFRHHSNRRIPISVRPPVLQSRRLARVIEYMQAHFDEPISLPELAGLCGLSRMHFSRAFRNAVGKPPHAYLIELRLEKAREFLEKTDLPITDIAFLCGFEQSQYFATLFRRKLGFTPSAWRSGA